MEKSRKKQRSMAIVAIVLMVCLVLALGTFTFAKYITSGTSGNQSATAAKWDFAITVTADQLFNDTYKIGEGEDYATPTSEGTSVSVKASTSGSELLAPGASSSMTIKIIGSAETKSKLTISVKEGYTELHCGDYYPVKWTLKEQGKTDALVTDGKLSDIVAYLNDPKKAVTFEANDNVDKTYTLSWEWAFSTEGKDAKDTAIGKKATDTSYTDITLGEIVATMSFELTVSVEQVQQ